LRLAELTLESLAKMIGVSRSTISRVINGSPNVSPEVREKVLKAIQSTGFHPNAAARSLASQRSWMIGLVLPRNVASFFTDPYFPQLTQGIAYSCNEHDLSLTLFLVSSKKDEEKIYPRILRSKMLDGVLIQSGEAADILINQLAVSNLPMVVLGRPWEAKNVTYIDVDNVESAVKATHHLVNLGYRRIATITGTPNSTVSVDRLEGYRKCLALAGRDYDPDLVAEGDFTENGGYEAMKQLLLQKADAVFCASDMMAAGAIRAIQEVGLRIPEDVALVGFDDIPLSGLTKIKLTTVRQPIEQFGIKAVELLIDLIEKGNKPARRMFLDTELVIRESCGADHAAGVVQRE
jgi:LacI family transcriptional regulator